MRFFNLYKLLEKKINNKKNSGGDKTNQKLIFDYLKTTLMNITMSS